MIADLNLGDDHIVGCGVASLDNFNFGGASIANFNIQSDTTNVSVFQQGAETVLDVNLANFTTALAT